MAIYKTISDAAHGWVREFNAFPLGMIEKLFNAEVDDWTEVTPVTKYDRVWCNDYQEMGEVKEVKKIEDEEMLYVVELDNGEEVETNDVSREDDSYFPMWGTMWQFGDSCDDWWLEQEGLQIMADCGFRVYESGEFGYFFGIDGAGYDFYEQHWIPLYKARGLQWHEEKED